MQWVSGSEILLHSGAYADPSGASPADAEWAALCADAVNGGIDHALDGALMIGTEPEVLWLARSAGVESYKRREATFGLTGYVDLQGAAIRVARDYLEAQRPILARYATFGLA